MPKFGKTLNIQMTNADELTCFRYEFFNYFPVRFINWSKSIKTKLYKKVLLIKQKYEHELTWNRVIIVFQIQF